MTETVSSTIQPVHVEREFNLDLEGREEEGLRFDIMVRIKEPKIQHLYTALTQKNIDRFIKTLANVYKAIESGIFYPNENWMCQSCGYKPLCEIW